MFRRIMLVLMIVPVIVSVSIARADMLEDIKSRGKLVVGVKEDYKPYGFRDAAGDIVGIEPSLAKDVADALEVELELVPVKSSNRMEFLAYGKIDLMIATMTDLEERREVVWIIEPHYYSSGANVLSQKEAELTQWTDLQDKPICGIHNAFYNKATQEEYGAKIIAFADTENALEALKQGDCIGMVYDDSFLINQLADDEWQEDFEMVLPTINDRPWGIAVALGEDNFAEFMQSMVEQWHANGRILALESEYGVPNTAFVQQMHNQYKP